MRVQPRDSARRARKGAIDSGSYLLLITIVGIGMVCGLTTLRDKVAQELGDVASALEQLDQSYSFTVGTVTSQYPDNVVAEPVPNPVAMVHNATPE